MKKTIIHLINQANPSLGGAQKIVQKLVKNLSEFDHIILEEFKLPSVFLIALISNLHVLKRIWLAKPDIAFIHHRRFLLLTPFLKILKIPAVFICHNIFPNRSIIMKILCPKHVVAVSGSVKHYLEQTGILAKIFIIHNSVDDPLSNSAALLDGTKSQTLRIGYIGSLLPSKGLKDVIQFIENYGDSQKKKSLWMW